MKRSFIRSNVFALNPTTIPGSCVRCDYDKEYSGECGVLTREPLVLMINADRCVATQVALQHRRVSGVGLKVKRSCGT